MTEYVVATRARTPVKGAVVTHAYGPFPSPAIAYRFRRKLRDAELADYGRDDVESGEMKVLQILTPDEREDALVSRTGPYIVATRAIVRGRTVAHAYGPFPARSSAYRFRERLRAGVEKEFGSVVAHAVEMKVLKVLGVDDAER